MLIVFGAISNKASALVLGNNINNAKPIPKT